MPISSKELLILIQFENALNTASDKTFRARILSLGWIKPSGHGFAKALA
jgi:hypothetical protein